MTALPVFRGYTVDERLQEFRKCEPGTTFDIIAFDSEAGRTLFAEYHNETLYYATCAICNEDITGTAQWDTRHDLHEDGCGRDGCVCDKVAHEDCCPGGEGCER